ncbi:MAG TPA: hypothetical protein VLC97_14550 [Rhodanobacteraceae bacterium]|nr:hypothetical protein [Rhodanobacteraceae bacterium]
MNYVLSRFLGRSAALLMLAAAMPGLAFADLSDEQQLAPTANAGALAGNSVAISDDGSVAVVGAPGDEAAYVFTRVLTVWTKVATLTASDNVVGDHFGASVSISGDGTVANIAVGAPGRASNAGGVYLFTGSGLIWTQNTNSPLVSALTSAGQLGTSVSIQGFRIASGAPHSTVNNKANTGVAIVFDSNDLGVTYTRSTFRANGGQARTDSLFGTSVSLSGNTVLVGAPGYHTGPKANSGSVFIFVNNGGAYTQQTNIRPANIANNFAGAAVSLFNNTAAFGTPGANGGKGAVYVYNRTGTTWSQTTTVANPSNTAGEGFGSSVAQLGQFLIAGAPGANSNTGAAYEFGGTNYPLLNQLIPAPSQAAGATFGFSASVNSGRALVGAPTDGAAGSAYVFKFLVPSVTKIVSTSVDPLAATTGVPYTVNVKVDHDIGGSGTPTGSVHIDDSAGGSCDAALDGTGNGSCDITSNGFGFVTLTATYPGDLTFSPSQDGRQQNVTGNHLVFNPTPPADVLQGTEFAGTVEVHNGADLLIASDNTTQVTITVQDSCGDPNTIGTVTVVNGVATFSGIGQKFYTVSAGLDISAAPQAGSDIALATSNVNVVANSDILFANGYEDCRL